VTDPFTGMDLVRAVAEHADEEAAELMARAVELRQEAADLENRATVLLQLHRIARPHVADKRPSETMRVA